MKSKLPTILLSLAALAFIVWVGSHLKFTTEKVDSPLRGAAAHNPFYAAIKLSRELGAEAAWERVFVAPREDAVIMISAWNWTLSRARRERIERWVEAGGRLVVDESLVGGFEEFEQWSGIRKVELGKDEREAQAGARAENRDTDLIGHYFTPRCSLLHEAASSREYKVCNVDPAYSLVTTRKVLWSLRDGDRIHAVRTPVGKGSVTVLNASPFRFRDLFLGDHARLLVAVTQLHRGDEVLFLTEEDHASLLTLLLRFGLPVVLLFALALALLVWRVSSRFGPLAAPVDAARRSLAEQIRGTGRFALRFGGGRALHAATVRALRDASLRHFPAWDRLSSGDRVASLARATGVAADDLGPALNFSGARGSHELRQAIAVLETARRRILLSNQGSKHGN